jgi:hypothetical protein
MLIPKPPELKKVQGVCFWLIPKPPELQEGQRLCFWLIPKPASHEELQFKKLIYLKK